MQIHQYTTIDMKIKPISSQLIHQFQAIQPKHNTLILHFPRQQETHFQSLDLSKKMLPSKRACIESPSQALDESRIRPPIPNETHQLTYILFKGESLLYHVCMNYSIIFFLDSKSSLRLKRKIKYI